MHTEHFDEDYSNHSLYSTELTPIALPEKKNKSYSRVGETTERKVSKLGQQIITQISIITPERARGFAFRKELKTFRYERRRKSIFGNYQGQSEREQQLLVLTLTSLFNEYCGSPNNKFYILLGNTMGIINLFHTQNKNKESMLVISSRTYSYSSDLNKEGIHYELLTPTETEKQKILIRNRNILLFWGYMINLFISLDSQLEIVSNFSFVNTIEIPPFQAFLGVDQRQEYQHIAKTRQTILGTRQSEVYLTRIEGVWLKENILNLYTRLKTDYTHFELEYEVLPSSASFAHDEDIV